MPTRQYVVVRYPEERDVYIDGQLVGKTNETLMVEEGYHLFDLGEPKDYLPESREVVVNETSSISPMEITFSARGVVS